jgi:hypothetical protein
LGGKEPLVLVNDGKRENILNDNSTFDRMEVGRGSFGELEILEEFHKT